MFKETRFYIETCTDGKKRLGREYVFHTEDLVKSIQQEFPLMSVVYLGEQSREESRHDSPFSNDRRVVTHVFLGDDGKKYSFLADIIENGKSLFP